jgi:hypothetical protein
VPVFDTSAFGLAHQPSGSTSNLLSISRTSAGKQPVLAALKKADFLDLTLEIKNG